MQVRLTLFTLFIIFNALNLSAQEIDYKGFPQWAWNKQDSTEYYLYTPSNREANKKYPVVLFLHGCCGTSYKATLRNTVDPPVRMWHNFGANSQKIPTYIIAPATSRGWKQHLPNLKKVIDDLIQGGQADPQRIYITGFSMGGQGTWTFLNQYPDYFAAALPMGMNFSGEPEKVKDIPIWTHKGETDYYARRLNKSVDEIRKLNGYIKDTSAVWETGINPRLTVFKGMGHIVQWPAASTQDLTSWAYSKINDGNKYPVVYFNSPSYKQLVTQKSVEVDVNANDFDGEIKSVEIFVGGKLVKTLNAKPFKTTIDLLPGDNQIEAKAIDDKGKYNIATTLVKTDIKPALFGKALSKAQQGAFYSEQIGARGNGEILYALRKDNYLPQGLSISADGRLTGVPLQSGNFKFDIEVRDEDGDVSIFTLTLTVAKKSPKAVLVSQVKDYSGKEFPVSVVRKGIQPHIGRADDEVTFSETSLFEGLTLIQTNVKDTVNAQPHYMEFTADEDVTVYVAYEKKDRLFSSTIPNWLKSFKKVNAPQIVAQYFYYDVYAKDYPKGRITLPDAEEKKNGVSTNYFVMVKKASEK